MGQPFNESVPFSPTPALTQDDRRRLALYFDSELNHEEVASAAQIPVLDYLDWAEQPHIAAHIARIARWAAQRARTLGEVKLIDAVRALALIANVELASGAGEDGKPPSAATAVRRIESARKAAAQLLRAALATTRGHPPDDPPHPDTPPSPHPDISPPPHPETPASGAPLESRRKAVDQAPSVDRPGPADARRENSGRYGEVRRTGARVSVHAPNGRPARNGHRADQSLLIVNRRAYPPPHRARMVPETNLTALNRNTDLYGLPRWTPCQALATIPTNYSSAPRPCSTTTGMDHPPDTAANASHLSPALIGEAVSPLGAAFEIKFLLTEPIARAVEERLLTSLLPDPHADPTLGGMYAVSSLNCDSPDLAVFHRDERMNNRKYRVRRYGGSPSVYLERKQSAGGKVRKRRVEAPASDLALIASDRAEGGGDAAHAWFVSEIASLDLAPVCRVRYLRRALFGVCADGPVRVTFDRNLRGSLARSWSLDLDAPEQPLLDGLVVCEFKFHDTMPALLKAIVAELGLQATGFSKYRACIRAFAPELGVSLAPSNAPAPAQPPSGA